MTTSPSSRRLAPRPLAAAVTSVALAALALTACGGSAEPSRASGPPIVPLDAGAPTAPPRAMRSAPLLGTSADNVLVDPGFSSSFSVTWGHWLAIDASGNQLQYATLVHGASPLGTRAAIAAIPATPAAATGGKPFDLLAPFPGGVGAAVARLWVSRNDPSGAPSAFDAAGSPLTISVLGLAGFSAGKGVDLARDEASTQVIGGRTWYLYAAEIPGGLDYSGFFDISVSKTGGNFWFSAPEVVPKTLSPLPQTMTLAPPKVRGLRASELAATAAYHRLVRPLRVGAQEIQRRLGRPE